jgi:ribosomal protein L7/L12
MSQQPSPEQIDQIGSALAAGKKIEAIKLYRETTGEGLKESKEFVEALQERLSAEDPERFAAVQAKGSGCATSMVVIASGLIGVTSWAITYFA